MITCARCSQMLGPACPDCSGSICCSCIADDRRLAREWCRALGQALLGVCVGTALDVQDVWGDAHAAGERMSRWEGYDGGITLWLLSQSLSALGLRAPWEVGE